MLVDLTGADVRSCLNTLQVYLDPWTAISLGVWNRATRADVLQFIKSRSPVVTEQSIRSLAVGSKDSSTSLQSAWSSLFVPLPAKVRRKQAGLSATSSSANSSCAGSTGTSGSGGAGGGTGAGVDDGKFIDRLHSSISTCGDVDKLLMGAFEHYPHLKPLDGSWANYCRLLDGPLYFYDTASKRIGEGGEWEMMAYTTYSVVSWYGLAAPANTTRAVEWPKADYEVSLGLYDMGCMRLELGGKA